MAEKNLFSNVEFRNIIAEEFSYFIGKTAGMRPCGDDAEPARYYSEMPPEMKPWVDLCALRIASRLSGLPAPDRLPS